jgi:hypothetical protein
MLHGNVSAEGLFENLEAVNTLDLGIGSTLGPGYRRRQASRDDEERPSTKRDLSSRSNLNKVCGAARKRAVVATNGAFGKTSL